MNRDEFIIYVKNIVESMLQMDEDIDADNILNDPKRLNDIVSEAYNSIENDDFLWDRIDDDITNVISDFICREETLDENIEK